MPIASAWIYLVFQVIQQTSQLMTVEFSPPRLKKFTPSPVIPFLEKKNGAMKIIAPVEVLIAAYAFQIMSATVLPAGMNGMTCVL